MNFFFYLFFTLSALTASFDLVGALDLAGGNLRITNATMLAFNVLGDALRDALDPRTAGVLTKAETR